MSEIAAYAQRLGSIAFMVRVGPGCTHWPLPAEYRFVAHTSEDDRDHAILEGGETVRAKLTPHHITEIALCLQKEGFSFVTWDRYGPGGELLRSYKRVPLTRFIKGKEPNDEDPDGCAR